MRDFDCGSDPDGAEASGENPIDDPAWGWLENELTKNYLVQCRGPHSPSQKTQKRPFFRGFAFVSHRTNIRETPVTNTQNSPVDTKRRSFLSLPRLSIARKREPCQWTPKNGKLPITPLCWRWTVRKCRSGLLLHVRRLATACRACTVTPTITRRESKSRMRWERSLCLRQKSEIGSH